MVKGKGKSKYQGKRKGSKFRPTIKKKKSKDTEVVNKKAIFNRYKDKQKLEDAIARKTKLDRALQRKQQQDVFSESDEEENAYGQLVSCFTKKEKGNAVISESESDEQSSVEDEGDVEMDRDINADEKKTDLKQDEDSIDAGSISESDETQENIEEVELDAEEEDSSDPFTKHLKYELADELLVSLSNKPPTVENTAKSWPILGNVTITIPKPIPALTKKVQPKISILEEKTYTTPGCLPTLINKVNLKQLHIKTQIQGNIASANKNNLIKNDLEITEMLSPLQKELFSVINNYQDLYYPERSFTNADEIRFTYCLHAVNHMLKTRTKIIHHNAKLAKTSNVTDDYRDQGLVRPKVLIIVPFKDTAYRVVNTIMDILVPKEAGQVVNKKRFEDDFTGGHLVMPKKNPKPEDYELLFTGNTDDTFRLGMTITKKTLKLYTAFYSSDMIVASPLGLRMIVGAEGEPDRDFDFLASVELLIVDQADVALMQNWEHLLHVLDHMHLQPQKTRGADFSRVRSWAVNGWSKYYRQTLLFSSVALPEIRAVMNRRCENYAGRVTVENPTELGSIRQVVRQVPQIFHRLNASSPLSAVESRFDYFVKEILPKQRDPLMSHTLIYVPSYFDYVRIRNYFKKEDVSFVQICEYSKEGKIARARDMFFHTEAHFLLYSERAHFFRRLRVKGVRHIVFYQPPTYPHFYSEMCNLMQESNQNKYGGSEFNMSVSVLYSKYDLQRVSAVLGAERTAKMAGSDNTVHMYVTGD